MTTFPNFWADETNVAALVQLFSEGFSSGQIGKALGISRNSAIGKIHRLGLTRPRPAIAQKTARVRKSQTRPQLHLAAKSRQETLQDIYEDASEATEAEMVESAKRCSLFELKHGKCRWPINHPGQADFAFCGNDAITGFSYCTGHARLAYRAPATRRSSPPTQPVTEAAE